MTYSPPTKQHLNVLAQTLARLHNEPGNPLILANVYDGGSARAVAARHPRPTQALATASYAIAAAQGVADDDLTWPQNRAGIASVVAGMRQAGEWGDGYADVAATVREAVEELGVVGANIEDYDAKGTGQGQGRGQGRLRSTEEAAARIRAAVEAARAAGVPDFVVNARTDVLGEEGASVQDAIERGRAFLAAGATTVFVWGVGGKYTLTEDDVRPLVDAFGGRLAVQPGVLGIPLLKKLGVARISVGPAVWRKAMAEFEAEAVRVMTES